jgi:ketosteroid isomerase-like protein
MRIMIAMLATTFLLQGASEIETAIQAAEKQFGQAIQARDTKTLEGLLSPDIIYAHATGNIETRQQYLDRLKGGKQRYDSYTQEKIKIVPHGNSVVSHLTVRVTGQNDAGPFNDHVLMMHHWVKQKGQWILVSHQTAKIP